MNNLGTDCLQKPVCLVHVGVLTGAQAHVMEADPVLHEWLAAMMVRAPDDAPRGSPADPITRVPVPNDRLHTQKAQEPLVKWVALLEAAYSHHYVGNAVDVHQDLRFLKLRRPAHSSGIFSLRVPTGNPQPGGRKLTRRWPPSAWGLVARGQGSDGACTVFPVLTLLRRSV